MVSPTVVVNRSGSRSSGVQEITLIYDSYYKVSVAPKEVNKDDTICFTSPQGRVRVVFVSPFNDNTVEMLDSEERKVTVGGCYHFLCFFTEAGEGETEARTGGILDVQPHRP